MKSTRLQSLTAFTPLAYLTLTSSSEPLERKEFPISYFGKQHIPNSTSQTSFGHPSLSPTSILPSNLIKIDVGDSEGNSVTERCESCGNDTWPKPSLAVDAIATRNGENGTEVLLIRRGNNPWKGAWAFPGGFVDEGEDPKDAVLRELLEETGIIGHSPRLHTVRGNPNRDPRKHIVSIFYYVDVDPKSIPISGDDAAHADWVRTDVVIDEGMAGDHLDVLLNL